MKKTERRGKMKACLTSINKPHTDNIFARDESERKTVEWRTKPLPQGKHYVYETKNKGGCGKVIGEVTVLGRIKYDRIEDISDLIIQNGKVEREFIKEYAKGKPVYANVLYGAKRYDTPKELGEFYTACHKLDSDKCGDCPHLRVERCSYPCDDDIDVWCGVDNHKPLTRPFQSWGYVEELTE